MSETTNKLEKKSLSFKNFTREQKLVFLCLSLGYLLQYCAGSLGGPFFPPEAARHGVSSSVIGIIFSVRSLISLFATPLFGPLIEVTGLKNAISGGIFFSAVFTAIFGLLENVESKEWFIAGCFVTDVLSSLGGITVSMSTLTYAAKMFPGNMNFVMGAMETYIAIAEVIGLVSGGPLYNLGGFKLPFILLSGLHLLVIPLNLFLLPNDRNDGKDSKCLKDDNVEVEIEIGKMANESSLDLDGIKSVPVNANEAKVVKEDEEKISAKLRLWHVFKIPRTAIMALTIAVQGICWNFVMTTLEPHLSPLKLSKTQVNMMFLMTSLSYGLTSPFWGWLADRVKKTWYLMAFGLMVCGFAVCFLGPVPFLGLENTVWLNLICLAVFPVSLGAVLIPALEATNVYAVEAGYEDNVATYGVVSSLIQVMHSVGGLLGPLSGGFILDTLGFPIGAGIIGSICFLWGSLLLGYFLLCHNEPIPRKKLLERNDKTPATVEPNCSENQKTECTSL